MSVTKTAKAPNYTEEQTAAIIAEYNAGKSVEEIAATAGRAVKSVRAKLVRENVYKAPEKAAKVAKDEGPTKKELVAELAELAPEFSGDVLDGFMNCTKASIQAVIDRLSRDEVAEDQAE